MIADIILGNNIDTIDWIHHLKGELADNILVLDYDNYGFPEIKEGVIFLSKYDIKSYITMFDYVNYYKSIYCYPGMNGKMSSLYKTKG